MSAPSDSGCCRNGVANVLSTTTSAPRSWASAATASMSTHVSSGLVGVSSHTMRVSAGHAAASADRSVRSTALHGKPSGDHTFEMSRNVPPYASLPSTMRSPCDSSRSTLSSAASPLANAKPWRAPSSDATHVSSAARVGLPLREYSNPWWLPTPSWANVVLSVIGVTTAPDAWSGA